MPRRKWTGNDIAILETYPQIGAAKIARELDRSEDSVTSMARRMGLRAMDPRLQQARTRVIHSPTVNAQFFDDLSPQVAYVLGFVWSCGTLRLRPRRVLLVDCSLHRQEALFGVQDILRSRHKIQRRTRSLRLEVCNSHLVDALVHHFGYPPKCGDLNPSLPNWALTHLAHFASGMLDGSGDKNENRIMWSGPSRLIGELQQHIRGQTGLGAPQVSHRGRFVASTWDSPEDVHVLNEWLPEVVRNR